MRYYRFLLLKLFWLAACTILDAQSIVWASKVTSFSSQKSIKVNAANQVLGKYNAMPQGGDLPTAWQPLNKTNNEFIVVEFEKPFLAKQLAIVQNYNAGAIVKVIVYNESQQEHVIYFGQVSDSVQKPKAMYVAIGENIGIIKSVKVVLDLKSFGKFSQIDAIALTNSIEPIAFKINQLAEHVFLDKPIDLGQNINSGADELNPVISSDGKLLYFVRYNHPENFGKGKLEDIWLAEADEVGLFKKAVRLEAPLNNESINSVASVTPDGNKLLLFNVYLPHGKMNKGVSISKKSVSGWDVPTPVLIPNMDDLGSVNEYNLASNGKILLITINRKDALGERDIYKCTLKDDGTWTSPVNLGTKINSAGDEASPFLASDNVTLYFSSNGYPGYGDNDIYITKRLDSTWTNWSEPINLSDDVNTANFDAYYTVSAAGDYAYYVSISPTTGNDIFKIALPKLIKPKPVLLLKGKIVNANTQQPVEADIVYQTLPDGKEAGVAHSSPETGDYQIALPYGKNYAYYAKGNGFISQEGNVDLKDTTKIINQMESQISVVPVEIGQHVTLNNLFFDLGKSEMKEASFPELDRVVKFLKENLSIEIEVGGHTDNLGTHDDNVKLSEARAKSVDIYFIQHGIDLKRIKYKGYGETQPIVNNDTEENRQKNRRVEFTILKK